MANGFLSPIALIVQTLSSQGIVRAGYKVNIYAPGTTIPVSTYADATLRVPNENPIVLLSDGRLPASIWAPAGTALKMVISDPHGRPILGGTVDNLPLIDDSFSTLHPRTTAEIAAQIWPTNYTYAPGNVLRYGADPTGVASSFAAVRNCMKAALTGHNIAGMGDHGRVYFPRGTYMIDSDGVFNDSADFQRGFIIEGDGLSSTVLKLKTNGADIWFYNNESKSTQQYIFVTVRDLLFTSDSTQYGNGFRFQQDQGWRFFRCWMLNLNTALDSEGGFSGNNGSEHRFYSCKFSQIHDAVHRFNNLQCLNIEYHGCDVESIFGDIFRIDAGGGGALRVFGGSYIMDDGGTPRYLLNINGGGLGNNNNTYTINGIQTELHSTNNRLVRYGSGSGGAHIVFNDCNITATNGAREQVTISTARVTFNRCVLTQNQGDTYRVTGPTAGGDQYGEPGSIHFNECDVPVDLSMSCSTPSNSGDGLEWGIISARGCYNNRYVPLDTRIHRYAVDFDLNWYNGGRASNFPGLKTVSVKPRNRSWPFADSRFDWIVTLPTGALIVNIQVFRPENSGSAGAYTLHVGNGDKSITYATDGGGISAPAARSVIVKYDIAHMVAAGTANPNNQVRIWADPTTTYGGAIGGYFIVQYY
jgi:hypothetical protein